MRKRNVIGALLLFLTVQTLSAETLRFGFKGGVPLTDAFQFSGYTIVPDIYPATGSQNYFSKTSRYTVGPSLEFGLPWHLSIELDALYKHLNYDYTSVYVYAPKSLLSFRQNSLDRWEFPLLLKYRLPVKQRILYVSAGPSLNYVSGSQSIETIEQHYVIDFRSRQTLTGNPVELRRVSTGGIAVGGGCELRRGILGISPELRYTRWINGNFAELPGMRAGLRSGQNQLEFLLGVKF